MADLEHDPVDGYLNVALGSVVGAMLSAGRSEESVREGLAAAFMGYRLVQGSSDPSLREAGVAFAEAAAAAVLGAEEDGES